MAGYTGTLRKRYEQAALSLIADPMLTKEDAEISPFLKSDLVDCEKSSKPRLIFPRSPRYNLELSQYLKHFSKWMWKRMDLSIFGLPSTGRIVASGLNNVEVANLIHKKYSTFDNCVVMECDAKAFEAHITQSHLDLEHSIYRAAYPKDKHLAWMLRQQTKLCGTLPCGAVFSRPGGRASGDVNTSVGNTMHMVVAISSSLAQYGAKFDVLVNGDNALVFLEKSDVDRVIKDFVADSYAATGFMMVLERPVQYMEHIRFGRSAPVQVTPNSWTMVRELDNIMSNAFSSYKHLRNEKFMGRWLKAVSSCELSLSKGLPMIQARMLKVLSKHQHRHVPKDLNFLEKYKMRGATLVNESFQAEVHPIARASFELAFGFTPAEQILFERDPLRPYRFEIPDEFYVSPPIAI